jgi:hypothetical protein
MSSSAIPERPLCTVSDWLPNAEDPDYEYARHNGRVLRLTKPLAQLLRLMDGRRTLAELAALLTSEGMETTRDEVVEILEEELVPKHYVTEAPADEAGAAAVPGERPAAVSNQKPSTPGLWWAIWLLKDQYLHALARPFAWLFAPWLALPLFASGAVFLTWYLATESTDTVAVSMQDPRLFGQAFLLTMLGIFWHEIGHAAACVRQGVRAGHLGFGFYYLFPVCFVDTNAAWTLRPRRRLWIDLGGLYFTLIFAVALAALYMLYPIPAIRVALYSQSFLFVINFNPFFRFDGYWALSDAFDLPNLHGQTRTLLEQLSAHLKVRQFGDAVRTLRQTPVITVYSILSAGFFLFFLRNVSRQSLPVLLHWPRRLYDTGVLLTQVWTTTQLWDIPIVLVGVVSATVTALGTGAALWLYVVRPTVVDLPRLLVTPGDAPRGTLTRVTVAVLILLFMLL